MTNHECKFCGEPCDLKEYGDQELALCGHCWRGWKKVVRQT